MLRQNKSILLTAIHKVSLKARHVMACLHPFQNPGRQTERPGAEFKDTKMNCHQKATAKISSKTQLVCVFTNLALKPYLRRHPRKIPKHLPHLILIWVTNLPNIPSLQCLLNSCVEYRFLLIHATYASTYNSSPYMV